MHWNREGGGGVCLGDDFDVCPVNGLQIVSKVQDVLRAAGVGQSHKVYVKLACDVLNGALVPRSQ